MENVMVIGLGGREHALAWKLAQSPHVDKVYVTRDTEGLNEPKFESVPLTYSAEKILKFVDFANENDVRLTVVGPEQPLVDGIGDSFRRYGLRLFGPGFVGASLESNKSGAAIFKEEYSIPHPHSRSFTDYDEALDYVQSRGRVYVKASGLAAGKGALDGITWVLARNALDRIMLEKEFGDAGNTVVIEDYIEGEEVSSMALINSLDGISVPLLPSQDHKKLLDEDKGPNTGGMGAYAPTTLVTAQLNETINNEILKKTVDGLRNSGTDYTGFLYPGLMITEKGPKVLEYNVRMGDPETQPLMILLKSDLYEVLQMTLDGKTPKLEWNDGYAICVVLAAKGYGVDKKPQTGNRISGLNDISEMPDVKVFHAGTKFQDGVFYTNGGRVLGVTAYESTIQQTRLRAYNAIEDAIRFDGMQFRSDIGLREARR